MMVSLVPFSLILLASSVLGLTSSYARELATSLRHQHRSGPAQLVSGHKATRPAPLATADEVYTGNWAGAVYSSPNNTWNSVSASFVVPNVTVPEGGNGTVYIASAWVGIDGYTCRTAILQAGVNAVYYKGNYSWYAWYEWFPDVQTDFPNFTVKGGDLVNVIVTANGTTGGTATIVNESSRPQQSSTWTFTDQPPLCKQNAEWIVEDVSNYDGLVPFANFSSVTFVEPLAQTVGFQTNGPGGAQIFEIEQDQILTSTSLTRGGQDITVTYL